MTVSPFLASWFLRQQSAQNTIQILIDETWGGNIVCELLMVVCPVGTEVLSFIILMAILSCVDESWKLCRTGTFSARSPVQLLTHFWCQFIRLHYEMQFSSFCVIYLIDLVNPNGYSTLWISAVYSCREILVSKCLINSEILQQQVW